MRLAPLFVLLAANVLVNRAWAADLPSGGVVAAGSASITAGANSLVVNQSSTRAIINWNNFSVGTGASVQFVQPGASSAVLNRVITASPSLLNGLVTANGQVFLVNPNGIIIGASSRIDAAGIFLSAGNIADADFLSGNIRFDPPPAETSIVILGALNGIDTIDIRAFSVDCSGSCALNSQNLSISSMGSIVFNPTSPLSIAPPTQFPHMLPAPIGSFNTSPAGGSLSISGGALSIQPFAPGSAGGSVSFRGTPSSPSAGAAVSTTTASNIGGQMSAGGMVDGAVTLRVSLVDASPIALR